MKPGRRRRNQYWPRAILVAFHLTRAILAIEHSSMLSYFWQPQNRHLLHCQFFARCLVSQITCSEVTTAVAILRRSHTLLSVHFQCTATIMFPFSPFRIIRFLDSYSIWPVLGCLFSEEECSQVRRRATNIAQAQYWFFSSGMASFHQDPGPGQTDFIALAWGGDLVYNVQFLNLYCNIATSHQQNVNTEVDNKWLLNCNAIFSNTHYTVHSAISRSSSGRKQLS